MALYYSPELPGFIDSELYGKLPADAIKITTEKYHELLNGLHEGYPIALVENELVLLERPEPVVDWSRIRKLRTRKLAACDWTQLSDVTLTKEQTEAWAKYRQSLRDITKTFAKPGKVIWPTEPK